MQDILNIEKTSDYVILAKNDVSQPMAVILDYTKIERGNYSNKDLNKIGTSRDCSKAKKQFKAKK